MASVFAILTNIVMTLTALPKRKEHIFMKGRVQPKNGYLYIVISRGKGLTPKWISTGLKDTAANARTAKKMVEPTIEEYKAQFLQEQKKIPTNLAAVITPTIQEALLVPDPPACRYDSIVSGVLKDQRQGKYL